MELQKLTLRNFKGVRDFTLPADGKSVSIFGANESGKTTVADALTWLLFGKDTRGRSADSFGIKTRDQNGDVIHNINHEVKGVFDNLTLKRTYTEKWTKKRGSSTKEFSGHTTDYEIDGVPVQAGEYQEAIEQIMPEELFKMLTIVDYFPEQMHWTDRREVLFDLVGDINTDDIIANYGDLERYPEVLGDRTHEQQEKVLNNRRKKLDKKLKNIPDRIDQETKGLYENVGDVPQAKETVQELKKKKETIESKRSEVKSGGTIADLKVERQELQLEYKKRENDHKEKVQEALSDQREKVSDLQDKVDEAESEWRSAKREYETLEDRFNNKQQDITTIIDEREDIKDREPKPANAFEPETCPVCERPMEDAEEHDYEQYLEEFNENKANEIKAKNIELQEAEDEAETVAAQLEVAGEKASKAKGRLSQRKEALKKAQIELKEQKANQPEFSDEDIEQQIEDIDEKIANHRQEKQSQLDQLDKHISDIEQQIEQAQQVIHKANENQRTYQRIEELKKEQQEAGEKLDQVEDDIHLMEEFVRARSAYVTDKVNDMFEHVEWKLFEEQINGGIKETCTAVWDGVPYDEGLNNAGRIKAGLDIINTLSNHYEKSAPVIIDNAEAITDIPDMDLQIIALYVSEEYPKLTVNPKQELVAA